MLTVLWTGLNIVLALLALYAWVRVVKILRREIGLGLALLFMVSFSLRGNNADKSGVDNLLAPAKSTTSIGNWSTNTSISISPLNKLHLLFGGRKTDSTIQATGLYVTTSGLTIGHQWKPMTGVANSSSTGVSYHVIMIHEWELMGIKLYTSSEEYKGSVPTQ